MELKVTEIKIVVDKVSWVKHGCNDGETIKVGDTITTARDENGVEYVPIYVDDYDTTNPGESAIITVETGGIVKDIELRRCVPECGCGMFIIRQMRTENVSKDGGNVIIAGYEIRGDMENKCDLSTFICKSSSKFVQIFHNSSTKTFSAAFDRNDGVERSAKFSFYYNGNVCKSFTLTQNSKESYQNCNERYTITASSESVVCNGGSLTFGANGGSSECTDYNITASASYVACEGDEIYFSTDTPPTPPTPTECSILPSTVQRDGGSGVLIGTYSNCEGSVAGTSSANFISNIRGENGSIYADVLENPDEERTSDVTITIGSTTKTIVVTQSGGDAPVDYWHTGLPVVVINTPGGQAITSKEEWMEGASISIYETPNSEPVYQNDALQIKGRGNSSWNYDKKPYALKLENKAELLGMTKSKRWALLANYEDRTLIRNDVALAIAKCTDIDSGMKYVPSGKFVELVLNGEHRGNYYLAEQIKVEKTRVDIDEFSDYLLELDRYSSQEEEGFWFKTDFKTFPITIKSPDAPDKNYIKAKMDALETAIYTNSDFSYLDFNSFADYWIVEELTENIETASLKPGSVYCQYIVGADGEQDKVIMGPVWDFDYSTFLPYFPHIANKDICSNLDYRNIIQPGSYSDPLCVIPSDGKMTERFVNTHSVYYDKLFDNEQFKSVVKQRWNAIKPRLDAIIDKFDEDYNYILKSEKLNSDLWLPLDLNGDYWPDKNLSFREAVNNQKAYYTAKLNFMNTKINSW